MNYNIGDAAKATGISAKMIRYYEGIGLIPEPVRTESGYRVYSQNEVQILRFVRRARDLGFSVEQIGELLDLWRDRNRASGTVKQLVQHHVSFLREKITALEAMCRALEGLACNCPGNERPDCPIIEGLAAPEERSAGCCSAKIRSPGGVLSGARRPEQARPSS